MDKKVIVFLSCLLIAIPLASAIAAFYVPPQKKSVQGIAVTKAVVPTDPISPTPTIFTTQTASKAAAAVEPSAKPTKVPRAEIKATVTLIPTVTPTAKVMPTEKVAAEPTPTIYIHANPTTAPAKPSVKPTAKPTVAAKAPTVTEKPSVSSVKIVENPSTIIMNEFRPTQSQTPMTQLDKDANLQN